MYWYSIGVHFSDHLVSGHLYWAVDVIDIVSVLCRRRMRPSMIVRCVGDMQWRRACVILDGWDICRLAVHPSVTIHKHRAAVCRHVRAELNSIVSTTRCFIHRATNQSVIDRARALRSPGHRRTSRRQTKGRARASLLPQRRHNVIDFWFRQGLVTTTHDGHDWTFCLVWPCAGNRQPHTVYVIRSFQLDVHYRRLVPQLGKVRFVYRKSCKFSVHLADGRCRTTFSEEIRPAFSEILFACHTKPVKTLPVCETFNFEGFWYSRISNESNKV